ncbi:HEPN domain-containing protein, partial [Candidatus Hakubella thermalkaliphila]
DWIKRAKSNLERAKAGRISQDVLYEDLCFDAQQCVEKSLKSLLVSLDVEFPWKHDIDVLFGLISKSGIKIPDDLKSAVILTRYAVHTRYPGLAEPVSEEDYQEALALAGKVFNWALKILREDKE